MSLSKIPKMIILTLALLKALDLKNNESIKIIQDVMYLWREFYIKTRIEVVPKEFIVEFKYKDKTLSSCRMQSLKDIRKLIQQLKESRAADND